MNVVTVEFKSWLWRKASLSAASKWNVILRCAWSMTNAIERRDSRRHVAVHRKRWHRRFTPTVGLFQIECPYGTFRHLMPERAPRNGIAGENDRTLVALSFIGSHEWVSSGVMKDSIQYSFLHTHKHTRARVSAIFSAINLFVLIFNSESLCDSAHQLIFSINFYAKPASISPLATTCAHVEISFAPNVRSWLAGQQSINKSIMPLRRLLTNGSRVATGVSVCLLVRRALRRCCIGGLMKWSECVSHDD